MLSMKAKYGLRALLYLARQPEQVPVLISELAEKEGIPKKFLELILLELKNHGVLQSKKGKGGGYFLRRKPETIKLGRVIRVLDGPLAPVPCVSQTAYIPCDECEDEKTCGIRLVMKEVRDAIANILDNTSLADVIVAGLGPTISRQGNRLAYVEGSYDTDIWKIEVPGSKGQGAPPARWVLNSSQPDMNPQYSPDGKSVAFVSTRSGSYQIWVSDSEGQNLRQLTALPKANAANPRWSPDGREIAFNSGDRNRSDVFVVSLEGRSPRCLTANTGDGFLPSWSQDGRWIYFGSTRSGDTQIWRMPTEGGEAVCVTKKGGFESVVAPGGKTLYYSKLQWRDGGYGSAQIWRVPLTGGEETPVFSTGVYARYWTLTERGIYFIRPNWSGSPPIEFFSFATDLVTQVVALERPPDRGANPGLSISPDGRWILCALVQQETSDIMLVENFR